MLRKILPLAVALLLAALPAMAEVYTGVTVAGETLTLTAASDGTIDEICVAEGEIAAEGQVAARFKTQKLFAAQDGTIAEIGAQAGESVSGEFLKLAPLSRYSVYCTVSKARAAAETMLVHSGETLYLRCTANGTHWAEGRVTQIDGAEYRVETTGGELYIGETVYLYRDADFSYASCVGIGTVVAADVEAYTAEGELAQLCVAEGEYVQRGELLCEIAPEGGATLAIPEESIVLSVDAAAGQTLSGGEALLTLAPLDSICIEIHVDEAAAATLRAGDRVEMTYVSDASEQSCGGTVSEISAVADADGYRVRIAPDEAPRALGLGVQVRVETDATF